jgi:glycogen(starch) synthase
MRILFVSNFYPPHYVGGYEISCSEAVVGLRARGHKVSVLTSTYGVGRRVTAEGVYRWLSADVRWTAKPRGLVHHALAVLRKEAVNQRAFRFLCKALRPDIVYLWNLTFISVSLASLAERLRIPLVFQASDYSLLNWRDDGWSLLVSAPTKRSVVKLGRPLIRIGAHVLGVDGPPDRLRLRHVHFLSEFLRGASLRGGLEVANPRVIHWGVDLDRFTFKCSKGRQGRILYVGQIVPHKGVQTVVEALRLLSEGERDERPTLTIAGGSALPDYEAEIRNLVSSLGLTPRVRFLGQVPREQLPTVYAGHDILVFPSVWDEPFGITLLEAMASGLPVVATATGGSGEILDDGLNALVFPKGDAAACAERASALLRQSDLYERIRMAGRRTVEARFRLDAAVGNVERALHDALP